jgi:hypothetical protein
MDKSVAGKERQYFSDSPDGTSLIIVAESDSRRHQRQSGICSGAV